MPMTDLTLFIDEFPVISALFILFVGACFGSFLNVVIHRLPLMMFKEWQVQCHELNADPFLAEIPDKPVSLASPASSCPSCSTPIHPLHNIPILSYLWLRARCAKCGTGISPRYFFVELTCAGLAYFVFATYGPNLQGLFITIFTFLLVPLIFIDIKHKLLPDNITYLLLWAGVIFSLSGSGIPLKASIIGIIIGYLSLWSVYYLFKLVTGKEGMGHGDFKLLAAIGAWVGWQQLLTVILISSVAGTIAGIIFIIHARRHNETITSIPFGPYLAVGGWVSLIWGERLSHWYLTTF